MAEQIKWPRDSAASRMVTNVVVAKPGMTVGEVAAEFRKKIREYESINYVYVTDEDGRLIGVFSIKKIFHLPKTEKVREIMRQKLVFAHPHTHQERVALLAIDHDLSAIPVIDKEGKLLGVVASDEILNILHKESIEDVLRFAGIHKFMDPAQDVVKATAITYFQKRLPWLVLGLLGGILAAVVVGFFEEIVEVQLLLAAFIPLVVYISDAVGMQTETIFVRSLALVQKLDLKNYILRELQVIFLLALVLSVLSFAVSLFVYGLPLLSMILGVSVFAAIMVAAAVAIVLPWLFYKMNYDPAIPSGPFATVITDILSVLIYFMIATALIKQFL